MFSVQTLAITFDLTKQNLYVQCKRTTTDVSIYNAHIIAFINTRENYHPSLHVWLKLDNGGIMLPFLEVTSKCICSEQISNQTCTPSILKRISFNLYKPLAFLISCTF